MAKVTVVIELPDNISPGDLDSYTRSALSYVSDHIYYNANSFFQGKIPYYRNNTARHTFRSCQAVYDTGGTTLSPDSPIKITFSGGDPSGS